MQINESPGGLGNWQTDIRVGVQWFTRIVSSSRKPNWFDRPKSANICSPPTKSEDIATQIILWGGWWLGGGPFFPASPVLYTPCLYSKGGNTAHCRLVRFAAVSIPGFWEKQLASRWWESNEDCRHGAGVFTWIGKCFLSIANKGVLLPSSVNLKLKLEYYNHRETLINVLAFYMDALLYFQ